MNDQQLGLDGSVGPVQPRSSEDAVLDQVVAMWREAENLHEQSENFADESRNLEMRSEDKAEEAEALAATLYDAHPEWKSLLDEGIDPRDRGED